MGMVDPMGIESSDFGALRRCLGEVVQGYQEIENTLGEFFEDWRKTLQNVSIFPDQHKEGSSGSGAPADWPSASASPTESLLAGQIDLFRRQSTELAETISQLHSVWSELTKWIQETLLTVKHSSGCAFHGDSQHLREELDRLQKERDSLQAQTRQLEALLASKTQEAAQLADLLEHQKHQMAHQQEQWAKHLHLLKCFIDSFFTHLAEFPPNGDINHPPENYSSEIFSEQAENTFRLPPTRGRKSSAG